MNISDLKREIEQKPDGVFAPYYYRAMGLREHPERVSAARAAGIYRLLSEPTPYLHKNDRIAGSMYTWLLPKDQPGRAEALALWKSYGERSFITNVDHYSPDYRKLVTVGLPGMLAEIAASKAAHAGDLKKEQFLSDMETALSGLRGLIADYADAAAAYMGREGYDDAALRTIRENCLQLLEGAPKSFMAALQLVWFTHLSFLAESRYAMALGRMDQYLWPFYERDLARGAIDEETATALFENVFMKIYEYRMVHGSDDVVNICIGGLSPDGSCDVNRLSICMIRAVKHCQIPGPNLSARVSANAPDEFLDECLKSIGTGLGYPALMNDEVNIAALRRYGYEEADIYDYSMVGCIENFITGKQPPWSDGRFDTPRFFEYLFNNGKAIRYPGDGIDTGSLDGITSMEILMERLETQLTEGIRQYMLRFAERNHVAEPEKFTQPLLSCFCDHCIARGMDINMGGAKYPSAHGVDIMGIGTISDSLAAIEKVVFVDHAATLADIRDAMLCNFEGCDALREKLLAAPKYGNNDDFVDKYAVWCVKFCAGELMKYHTYDGGGIYACMASNISNIEAGSIMGATPDGRLAGEPLSDAASPTYGRDRRGMTAVVASLTKPDYTCVACGSVVNQKFSPSMFEDGKREKLAALLRVYFARGGQEMQINATSREVLMDAMEHPERYPTMVVRVSGYSAIFVTLPKAVQTDILNRTQQA